MIPSFVPIRPQWRGNTSSEDMNQNFEQILYDLNTVFQEASQIVMTLNDLESRIRHDTDSIRSQVYSLSGVFNSYEQSDQADKIFFEEFHAPQTITYPSTVLEKDRCRVDTEYGVATLPINSSFSKVYTTNISTGEIIVAPDVTVLVSPLDEAGAVKVDETSAYTAFDGQSSTVWERKVRFDRDSAKSAVTCLMTVTLPSMSNPYVNKLHIKPYPEGYEDVTLITYDTASTQDNVLSSFPALGENNIISKMYSFDNIQPTNIKIYFRKQFSEIEDNQKTFIYGAREIGIEKVEYLSSGIIGFKFTLPEYESGLLNKITSFQTTPSYDDITYKANIYASEAEFNSDLPIWTSSNQPITSTNTLDISGYGTETVWVMIELLQTAGESKTPILTDVSMTYTTI